MFESMKQGCTPSPERFSASNHITQCSKVISAASNISLAFNAGLYEWRACMIGGQTLLQDCGTGFAKFAPSRRLPHGQDGEDSESGHASGRQGRALDRLVALFSS
jgi:hypothetical protein